jgi:hypothetical protein
MAQIIEKPFTRGRVAGLVWGAFGTALGGGFFLGAVLGGWTEDNVLEAAIASFTLPVASAGLLIQMGRRTTVGVPVRLVLFLAGWVGGFLVGFGARAGADLRYMAQLRAWFGTTEAKAGIALVLTALILTVMLSLRRPAEAAGKEG